MIDGRRVIHSPVEGLAADAAAVFGLLGEVGEPVGAIGLEHVRVPEVDPFVSTGSALQVLMPSWKSGSDSMPHPVKYRS